MMVMTNGMTGTWLRSWIIGWTGHWELHIVGISMRGTISQGEDTYEYTN